MKTLITFFLLTVLLFVMSAKAQKLPDNPALAKPIPFTDNYDSSSGNVRQTLDVTFNSEPFIHLYNEPGYPFLRWMELPWQLSERYYDFNERKTFIQSNPSLLLTQTHNLSGGVQEAWVRHYASYLIPGDDEATALAVDSLGNVYIAGSSLNGPFGLDYLTIKYNTDGTQVWAAFYNGSGSAHDVASAIYVDAAGNVYVTGSGYSAASDIGYEYATVKYNSAGVEQWVACYNGPENYSYDDMPTAIAVDESGNVYVTGYSLGSDEFYDYDYATIKYNSDGVEQWVARYKGSDDYWDRANALGVDALGNVYVTGCSYETGTGYDYTTIKYNSTGSEEWIVQYQGQVWNDRANALAIDDSGNIYVTGRSYSPETSDDCVTIKYNNAGVEQWIARYNGPGNDWDEATALTVDDSGNVYVAGVSRIPGAGDDYVTIKYNSTGDEQWVTRYSGHGRATAITVDAVGNVYVTGYSMLGNGYDYVTIRYDSAGNEQWVARYNGPGTYEKEDKAFAIAVDNSGNAYITGLSEGADGYTDCVTIKYNNDGFEQWIDRYDGPGNSADYATAIALDDSGNIYITGHSLTINTLDDYATVKYNSAGRQQWIARYKESEYSYDQPTDLVVDALGNVYVTGNSGTVKYNRAGVQQWATVHGATALAVDNSGNVYVTGSSEDSGTGADYTTLKYNSAGVELWIANYNGPGNSDDYTTALVIDDSCNVYVTGYSKGFDHFDYATVKYYSDGVEHWITRYQGPGNADDRATDIAVDKSGNVYVTGTSVGSGTSQDYATIKYNSNGGEQWVARYNRSENSSDFATALAIDDSANVFVTGYSKSTSGVFNCDYTTIKYNNAGEGQWVAHYNGSENGMEEAIDLALDYSGNVYVTGYSSEFNIYYYYYDYHYATIKYSSAGIEQWVARHDEPGISDDKATALAVDNESNAYVTGSSKININIPSWCSYTTIKYVQTPVSVKEEKLTKPKVYWLSQNYPNPFNATTNIHFVIPKPGYVEIIVYNIAGQEVTTLVSEKKMAGEHEVQWSPMNLPSGVYIYRLQAGDFSETRKLILLK